MGLISLSLRMKPMRKERDGRRLRGIMLGEIDWLRRTRIFGIELDRCM